MIQFPIRIETPKTILNVLTRGFGPNNNLQWQLLVRPTFTRRGSHVETKRVQEWQQKLSSEKMDEGM